MVEKVRNEHPLTSPAIHEWFRGRIARDGVAGTHVTPPYPDSRGPDPHDHASEFRHWRTGGAWDAMSANAAANPGVLFALVALLALLESGVVMAVRRRGRPHADQERADRQT